MHGVPPPYSHIPLCYGALLTKGTTLPLAPLPYQHLKIWTEQNAVTVTSSFS